MEIRLDLKEELKNFLNKDNQYTIPIFIPHKGCPNNCVFCNQKRISGQMNEVTVEDVDNTISKYLSYYTNSKKIEVAFFGGSFTGIDIEDQIKYLEVANKYVRDGRIDSIRISTRPDYITDEILEIMVGLPNSTLEDEVYTIKECLKLKPSQLRIYPVYVIEDSELYDMYNLKVYKPLDIAEAVKRCIAVIDECRKTDVSIIRLGLQSTSEITAANSHIYGPVSDNLAEYVLAGIVRKSIESKLPKDLKEDIQVYVPKKYISITVGPKKVNKIYFENKYNVKYVVKGES